MTLHEIERSYLDGKELSEINESYKEIIAEAVEEDQIRIWKQVCSFANVEIMAYLIEQGWRAAGVEDAEGNTLLHFLAQPQHRNYYVSEKNVYDCAKMLLEAKVSTLRKNSYGETALQLAANIGYFEMLHAYQEVGGKADFLDRNGNTILHILAQSSSNALSTYESAMERLQAHQNDPSFDANNPRHAQKRAELEWFFNVNQARFNQYISFVLMAMEFGADPFQKNNEKETAVDVAIRYKSKAIGAILNGVDLSNQETAPLYFQAGGMNVYQACAKNDLDALNALIKLGENLNETYDKEGDKFNGMTPLSIAMMEHRFEITEMLLKNGADAMLRDSKSWHPFRYLYTPHSNVNTNFDQFQNKVFPKILKSYLEAGFDINSFLDDEENTLLTLSARYSDTLMLFNSQTISKVLIEEAIYSNADVNKTNRDGVSALMYLCLADENRGEKNLITLLEQGASTELRDKSGKTALMYAVNNSTHSVAKAYCELLAEFGNLVIEAKDNNEKSAIDYAAERNNEALVAWLLEKM